MHRYGWYQRGLPAHDGSVARGRVERWIHHRTTRQCFGFREGLIKWLQGVAFDMCCYVGKMLALLMGLYCWIDILKNKWMLTYRLTLTVLQSTSVRNDMQQEWSQHNIKHRARSGQQVLRTTNCARSSPAAGENCLALRCEHEHVAHKYFN